MSPFWIFYIWISKPKLWGPGPKKMGDWNFIERHLQKDAWRKVHLQIWWAKISRYSVYCIPYWFEMANLKTICFKIPLWCIWKLETTNCPIIWEKLIQHSPKECRDKSLLSKIKRSWTREEDAMICVFIRIYESKRALFAQYILNKEGIHQY